MYCIVPHVQIRTCEAGMVFDVCTRVGDTCDVFVSAVGRVCVRYSDVLHVCMYSTTYAYLETYMKLEKNTHCVRVKIL